MRNAEQDALAFAEQLMTLLDEGRYTATYKFAVLLALMDLCMECSTDKGYAPQSITTQQLASKVVELYWPHAGPYPGGGRVLFQNRPAAGQGDNQAKIITHIVHFRERFAPDATSSMSRARLHNPEQFARLVKRVEWSLVEMPLPRLQRFGRQYSAFIYQIRWDESVRKRDFNDSEIFDNVLRFVGNSGEFLVRLSGLLRPLIQRNWSQLVGAWNQDLVPQADLEEFLFGRERISLQPIRSDLYDLQNGRCFYTGARLKDDFEVDHFFPWARLPNNGLENLVLANRTVNNNKSDHLVGSALLQSWVEWTDARSRDLDAIAARRLWERHPGKSVGILRSAYLRLAEGAKLWSGRDNFEEAEPERLRAVLS